MTRLRVCDDGFTFPIDWLTLSTVVYGSSGSGKTVFGKVCCEEAHKAGVRFCVIDIKGDYYGLKSTSDGKGDGIPVVIFGGDHAELPLAKEKDRLVQQAGFIAELIAASDNSFIIDLEHHSKSKQIAFLGTFFERLYEVNRVPLLLVMDEAQRYAPQKPQPGTAMETLGAVEDIVKLGRKHGIGRLLLTQRGSGLSKETSEICDMMVAFRTPGTLDQTRAKDWLNANVTKDLTDEVMPLISGLDTGQAIFASNHPDLRKGRKPMMHVGQVRRAETFDSSATPRIGKRKLEPKRLAKADLEAITEKMAEYVEEAERNDPAKLNALLKKLEREVAAKDRTIAQQSESIEAFHQQVAILEEVANNPLIEMHQVIPVGLPEELNELIEQYLNFEEMVSAKAGAIDRTAAKIKRHMEDLLETGAAIEALEKPKPYGDVQKRVEHKRARGGPTRRSGVVVQGGQSPPMAPPPPRSVSRPPAPPAGSGRGRAPVPIPATPDAAAREDLSGVEKKVVDAIAWWNVVGIDHPSKQQVGWVAGYKVDKKNVGGTYGNLLSALKRRGYLDYPVPGRVGLTALGKSAAETPDVPFTTEALQQIIMSRFDPAYRKVLQIIIDAYPDEMHKADVGEAAGYTVDPNNVGGTFGNILGRLRSFGLIDYPHKGHVVALPLLFLD